MLSPKFSKQLIERMRDLDKSKREVQQLATSILHASKRAIFAFHREDKKEANRLIDEANTALKQGWLLIKKQPKLAQEGSWRAAQEEFAEANLMQQYLQTGKLDQVKNISDDPDVYLGGLSDLTGELTRRAVMLATDRRGKEVEQIFQEASAIIKFLLEMDLTGSLRTKVDQAKSNLRKLEEIRYDLSLRK